jgi:hypothetical protein
MLRRYFIILKIFKISLSQYNNYFQCLFIY